VTTIYVDGSVLAEPDARTQLEHLAEAGFDVVHVSAAAQPPPGAGSVPEAPKAGSWFVTADPDQCEERRPGFRTLLVGPRPEGPRPTIRCDVTARDAANAVLEILASEAMT
jgi:hypothetical protein